MVRDAETSHFWLGYFPNPAAGAAYFAEVWDAEDEDREHTPLSAFARDQGETWYDHDFMEHGYSETEVSLPELVEGHSYSEQWAEELIRRAGAAGLEGVNTLVFISQEEIREPRSVQGDGYWLHYLGTLQYVI